MRLPSLNYLWYNWYNAFKRFPIAVFMTIAATACGILLIKSGQPNNGESIFKILLSLLVFFPAFISTRIIKEAYAIKTPFYIALNLVLFVFLFLYWKYMAPDPDGYRYTHVVQFFIFAAVTHLIVTFVPYLKNNNLTDFWEYNRSLFINYFVGALYSVVLVLGIFAAITAINYLFDADIDGEWYGYVVVFIAGIFHTGYFLSAFPKNFVHNIASESHDRAYVNMVKYVLISLISLYLIILYAFGIKILINWELPKGFVASLVLGFSIAGILTYLLNYRLPEIEGSGWVKIYKKWFFVILLPVTSLLFVGIWRRISEYGFTEERYFVLITGVFLAFVCLYFIFSKRDDIRVIPIALLLSCLICGVGGPFSSFSISKNSQKKIFLEKLHDVGAVKDGVLIDSIQFTVMDKKHLKSSIAYFTERRYMDVFKPFVETKGMDSLSNYILKQKMYEAFGLSNRNIAKVVLPVKKKPLNYYTRKKPTNYISDYDYHSQFIIGNGDHFNDFDLTITVDSTIDHIIVKDKNGKTDKLKISTFLQTLKDSVENNNRVPLRFMTFEESGDERKYKFVFDILNIDSLRDYPVSAQGDLFWQ